jgi:hypothetical protein
VSSVSYNGSKGWTNGRCFVSSKNIVMRDDKRLEELYRKSQAAKVAREGITESLQQQGVNPTRKLANKARFSVRCLPLLQTTCKLTVDSSRDLSTPPASPSTSLIHGSSGPSFSSKSCSCSTCTSTTLPYSLHVQYVD